MKREATDFANPALALQSRGPELTSLAHKFVMDALRRHGNGVSENHSMALWQLLSGFTDQGLHINSGRFAYALPCGAGKTMSVVAWIAAQYHLRLNLSLAVSAQQIDALSTIKAELIALDVPESHIGIRHSKGKDAAYPDTGEDDRKIMLGSHARIRGADEMPAFCRHKGASRDLLFWDESLISSDATVLSLDSADTALMHFAKNVKRPQVQAILAKLRSAVHQETDLQQQGCAARTLAVLSEEESEAALLELRNGYPSKFDRNLLETAQRALRLMKHPVSLLNTGSGESGVGLMRYRIMIDPELNNIAVLDASYGVRELCKADPTIRNRTTEAMIQFKSYEDVRVKHTVASSGRSKFNGSSVEKQLAVQAAVDSIRSIPIDEHVLVFTYKTEGPSSLVTVLKNEIRIAGIDPDAMLSGKSRISFSTWGRHTTDNSYSHVKHVVLLGVLRMDMLDLGAAMAGQKDDLSYRLSKADLLEVEYSELASHILQAANRGQARLVTSEGKALPMTIHLVTKERQLRPLLEKAMPGLQWESIEAARGGDPHTRTSQLAAQIKEYVTSLPSEQLTVSKKTIIANTDIRLGAAAKAEAMAVAVATLRISALSKGHPPWEVRARGLIREARP